MAEVHFALYSIRRTLLYFHCAQMSAIFGCHLLSWQVTPSRAHLTYFVSFRRMQIRLVSTLSLVSLCCTAVLRARSRHMVPAPYPVQRIISAFMKFRVKPQSGMSQVQCIEMKWSQAQQAASAVFPEEWSDVVFHLIWYFEDCHIMSRNGSGTITMVLSLLLFVKWMNEWIMCTLPPHRR